MVKCNMDVVAKRKEKDGGLEPNANFGGEKTRFVDGKTCLFFLTHEVFVSKKVVHHTCEGFDGQHFCRSPPCSVFALEVVLIVFLGINYVHQPTYVAFFIPPPWFSKFCYIFMWYLFDLLLHLWCFTIVHSSLYCML